MCDVLPDTDITSLCTSCHVTVWERFTINDARRGSNNVIFWNLASIKNNNYHVNIFFFFNLKNDF